MITARLALEENRDVFILPARISDPDFLGSLSAIRDGLWKLIMRSEDILCEYWESSIPKKVRKIPSDLLQSKIFSYLDGKQKNIDDLSEALQIETPTLLHQLALMEIQWYIQKDGSLYSQL